jgi:hypothetical protein
MTTYSFESLKSSCPEVKQEAWAGKYGTSLVRFSVMPEGRVYLYLTSSTIITTLMFEPEQIAAFLADGVTKMKESKKAAGNVILFPSRKK